MDHLIVGEALADGSTIKWQYFSLDDLSCEEKGQLSAEEIKAYEENCMEKNAWKVCSEVCCRINGEPAPCGDMTAHVTYKPGKIHSLNFDILYSMLHLKMPLLNM